MDTSSVKPPPLGPVCPNCGDSAATCPSAYSQRCWESRVEKLEAQLARGNALESVLPFSDETVRVEHLERLFAGALHAHRAEERPALPLCNLIRQENLGFLLTLARRAVTPVPIAALYCPVCKTRHIDEGEFGEKVHHTHACQGFVVDDGKRRRCGHVWRPAKVATVGVEALPGYINERTTE